MFILRTQKSAALRPLQRDIIFAQDGDHYRKPPLVKTQRSADQGSSNKTNTFTVKPLHVMLWKRQEEQGE